MKIIAFSILTIIISTGLYSQNEPDFAWAKRIGNNSTVGVDGPVVTVDQQGNSYQAGVWLPHSYTLDGIPLTSPISTIQTNPNGYIAKYDTNGQIIWAKSMTNIRGIAQNTEKLLVDEQGNIYFCSLGAVDGHCIINGHYLTDPNAIFQQFPNRYKMFLAKLDSDGNVLWTKNTHHTLYYGSGFYSGTNEIHFDLDGNINMAAGGYHNAIIDLDDTLAVNTDEAFMFFTKYSPAGDVLTHKKLIGTYPKGQFGTEYLRADASGNLYRWSGRNNNNPKCLYRYDAAGELLDSLILTISTTSYYPELKGFAVSPTGDIFIGGAFFGNLTLEGTTYNGVGSGIIADAVLFKLAAPNYEVDWVRFYQTTDHEAFNQLLTDGLGNVYALGQNILGVSKMILQKYTNDGALLWDLPLGTGSDVTPTSLCQSQNGGNIWVGGRFRGGANFAPGYNFTTPNNNHYNGFLAQYGLCNTETPVVNTPATTILCGQENITLSANLNDPALTYFWSTPTGTVAIGSSSTTTQLTVTQPGKYYLVAQENAECYGKSQEIWVTQAPLPDTSVILQTATLTAVSGNTYQWLDCDNGLVAINGATAVSFTPIQNGTYAVEVTSPAGCTDTSACFTINNLSVTEQTDLAQLISIYPNPAKDEINIEGVSNIKSVRILDLQGKELMHTKGDKVTISTLSSGVYLIEITTLKGVGTKRFVKK